MTQNDNIKQNEELKEELEKDLWLDSNDNDNEFIENDDNIDSELDENQNDEINWSIHLAYRDFLKIR